MISPVIPTRARRDIPVSVQKEFAALSVRVREENRWWRMVSALFVFSQAVGRALLGFSRGFYIADHRRDLSLGYHSMLGYVLGRRNEQRRGCSVGSYKEKKIRMESLLLVARERSTEAATKPREGVISWSCLTFVYSLIVPYGVPLLKEKGVIWGR